MMTFEQQGDLQCVGDQKAAPASDAIRRDSGMLTCKRALNDLDILRDVVRFSRDSPNSLLITADPVRPSAPVPATLAGSPNGDPRLQMLLLRPVRGPGPLGEFSH
jgi:hypothetical protein